MDTDNPKAQHKMAMETCMGSEIEKGKACYKGFLRDRIESEVHQGESTILSTTISNKIM